MSDFDNIIKNLSIKDDLFKGVKYYVTGTLDSKVKEDTKKKKKWKLRSVGFVVLFANGFLHYTQFYFIFKYYVIA